MPTQSFDISGPACAYNLDRRGRGIALLVGVLVLVGSILGVSLKVASQDATGYRLSEGQWDLYLSFTVLFVLLLVYALWLVNGIAPAANKLVVSDLGFELSGPGSRVERHGWEDPGTSLSLWNHASDRSQEEMGLSYSVDVHLGRTHALTQEAYDRLLYECKERGLIVPDTDRDIFVTGRQPTLYRIRGRPPKG